MGKARPAGTPCVLAIVGSRDFPDVDAVRDFVLGLRPTTKVISGGARGVDLLAVNTAKARGLEVEVIPVTPDEWNKLGKAAGPLRNTKLVEQADFVVAFLGPCKEARCKLMESCPRGGWSHGTSDTIEKARAAGKLWAVYYPRPGRA
jgi:hypothetical protein